MQICRRLFDWFDGPNPDEQKSPREELLFDAMTPRELELYIQGEMEIREDKYRDSTEGRLGRVESALARIEAKLGTTAPE